MIGGSRTYVFVDFRCNNACVFCDQGEAREVESRDLPAEDHVRALADDGVDSITFCGGEVTLDLARLEGLVSLSQKLGIEDVGIQTNGRRLAYSNIAQRLVDAGVRRFDISLHGTNETTHDWVTRDPGAFKQTIRGLREIRRAGAEIILHMVLLRSNFRQALEMVKLAAKFRVRVLNFRFVEPEGRVLAEASFPSIVPKYSLVQPTLMLAKAVAKRMGVSLFFHGFPDCALGSLASGLVREKARWVGVDESMWPRNERTYAENCVGCALKNQCLGVPQQYLEYYGDDELVAEASEVSVDNKPTIASAV